MTIIQLTLKQGRPVAQWMSRSESFLLKVQGGALDVVGRRVGAEGKLARCHLAGCGFDSRRSRGGRRTDGSIVVLAAMGAAPFRQHAGCLLAAAFHPFGETLDAV